MKRGGILNPGLLWMLAHMGHTDHITISDRGFPVPTAQSRVDLSLIDGTPTVLDVLAAVHGEFAIDRIIVTEEMREFSPERFEQLQELYPKTRFDAVTHLDLKYLCADGKGTIRTGDNCPYANLIIVSG